jgi:hypothetical protein
VLPVLSVLSRLLAHGGAAGALAELAVILGMLALFAGIAWLVGRRALSGQERASTEAREGGDPQPPPLA